MGSIIILGIIIYIFREPIFGFFGLIFGFFGFLFDIIVDIKDKIVEWRRQIKRRAYAKKCELERKARLDEIDREYAAKNYKRVISLFREVMAEGQYSYADKIKYCRIAADSVCNVAQTVGEWEEARTWAVIINKQSGSYKSETDEIYKDVTMRGGEIFDLSSDLMAVGIDMLEGDGTEAAKLIFEEASADGNFVAMCIRTELAMGTVRNEDDLKDARKWIGKVKTVDSITGRRYEQKLEDIPYMKREKHRKKAQEYIKKAKNATGDEYIRYFEQMAKELEGVYQYSSAPDIASDIMSAYISLAEEQKKYHPKGNDSFAKYANYYKRALKWAEIAAEGGDETAKSKLEGLEARVKLNDMVMQIGENRANT